MILYKIAKYILIWRAVRENSIDHNHQVTITVCVLLFVHNYKLILTILYLLKRTYPQIQKCVEKPAR